MTLFLHVPEPEVRPGDMPDFSNVVITKAGEIRRGMMLHCSEKSARVRRLNSRGD